MIATLLIASAVAAAPAPAAPSVSDLLAGAEHAAHAGRVDQARTLVARAVGAGASGPKLERVFADLAFLRGQYADALAHYETLLKSQPSDASLLEPAGIAALKLGDIDRADRLLSAATESQTATWRAWNALGVVADLRADWNRADECFARAVRLAPNQAGPINNRGWSHVLRGEWSQALAFFERAAVMDPDSTRAINNLELAKSALANDLPKRLPGETEWSWAQRLNDAGVTAAILGDRPRATAAFTQALEASGAWYTRAANNLEALSRE